MISPMISPNFKRSNLDTEVLENMNAITPSDELSKALKKEGLVQKDVTVQGKNGTYTRKQWVRASEAASGDSKSTSTEQPKEDKAGKTEDKKSSISFSLSEGKNAKQSLAEMLSSGTSRVDIMSAAKEQGISWKENDHEGINWMRASMAIQKHMNEGGSAQSQDKTTDNATEQPKQENKQKSSADNSNGKLQVGQTVYCDQIGNGKSKVTVTGLDGENGKITVKNGRGSEYDVPMSSLYSSKEDAENGENSIADSGSDNQETTGGKSEKPESVIGKDYTKLTTEDEARTIEGQAHNMMVGNIENYKRWNGGNTDKVTDEDIKSAAIRLATNTTKEYLRGNYHVETGGKASSSHEENNKLIDKFHELGGISRQDTMKQIAQDKYERPEIRSHALVELLGKNHGYDMEYHVTPGNTVEASVDVGGKYLTEVKIKPKFGGYWNVEFVYPDGVSRKETYDSVKSVQEASDKFIKDQKSKK